MSFRAMQIIKWLAAQAAADGAQGAPALHHRIKFLYQSIQECLYNRTAVTRLPLQPTLRLQHSPSWEPCWSLLWASTASLTNEYSQSHAGNATLLPLPGWNPSSKPACSLLSTVGVPRQILNTGIFLNTVQTRRGRKARPCTSSLGRIFHSFAGPAGHHDLTNKDANTDSSPAHLSLPSLPRLSKNLAFS